MIDNQKKTQRLLADLRAALPFEVELAPLLVGHLRSQGVAGEPDQRCVVSNLSYAGDEGGIICHLAPSDGRNALVVSPTQLRVRRPMPFAPAVADYQKHRIKRLKRQR
jgi:hypothetical protein